MITMIPQILMRVRLAEYQGSTVCREWLNTNWHREMSHAGLAARLLVHRKGYLNYPSHEFGTGTRNISVTIEGKRDYTPFESPNSI